MQGTKEVGNSCVNQQHDLLTSSLAAKQIKNVMFPRVEGVVESGLQEMGSFEGYRWVRCSQNQLSTACDVSCWKPNPQVDFFCPRRGSRHEIHAAKTLGLWVVSHAGQTNFDTKFVWNCLSLSHPTWSCVPNSSKILDNFWQKVAGHNFESVWTKFSIASKNLNDYLHICINIYRYTYINLPTKITKYTLQSWKTDCDGRAARTPNGALQPSCIYTLGHSWATCPYHLLISMLVPLLMVSKCSALVLQVANPS